MKDRLEGLVMEMYKGGVLFSEGVREFKKRFILTVLRENLGNQCKAARQMGMHRNTLSRTLSELKIDLRAEREAAALKKRPQSHLPVRIAERRA